MNTHAARYPAAGAPRRLAHAIRSIAERLDAWLVARRKSADDHATLRGMSARELKDIGLDPGHASNHGQGDWVRDWA